MTRRSFAILTLGAGICGLSLAAPPWPDLIVDQFELAGSWRMVSRYFPPGDCAVAEGCVNAAGHRRLIIFNTVTANIARSDLFLGDPNDNPLFEYDTCHEHSHLLGYAGYRILDSAGGLAAPGRKQAFCLVDTVRYLNEPWAPLSPFYDCDYQGLLPGWADIYNSEIPCQYVDVTDVAPGSYRLSVTVNPDGLLRETDVTNNNAEVPVTIPNPVDPDLTIRLTSVQVQKRFFGPTDPAVQAGCVGGTGYRRLISFTTRVANNNPVDVFLGLRYDNPLLYYDSVHGHTHFAAAVKYELLDTQGQPASVAVRPGMCLKDDGREVIEPWVPGSAHYSSFISGLQGGWFAEEASSLVCQWLDVTDLTAGSYLLRSMVDPDGFVQEEDETNNTFTLPVPVRDPPGLPHVPDGSYIPGEPLLVERSPPVERLTWEVSPCVSNYNVYYGIGSPGFSYRYDGSICNIGITGAATVLLPDPAPGGLVWFNVIARSGNTEGGHGFDSSGRERPLTGVGFCLIDVSQPASFCPL